MRTASAAKKALLVIINTKSFQPQPFPAPAASASSLNSLKKRRRRSPSSKITTNFGLRPNQYAGAPASYHDAGRHVCRARPVHSARSKWPPAFARSHWRFYDIARTLTSSKSALHSACALARARFRFSGPSALQCRRAVRALSLCCKACVTAAITARIKISGRKLMQVAASPSVRQSRKF